MIATIVQNAYKLGEEQKIIDALDDLCSPSDSYGWASNGIYAFWDYDTKEVLYIGLAVDLKKRFQQHTGESYKNKNNSKYDKIRQYFTNKNLLGYSVFLQSPLSQAVNHSNLSDWFKYDSSLYSSTDFSGTSNIRELKSHEGILLETFRKRHNRFPRWNSIGGNLFGQRRATKQNYELIEVLSTPNFSILVSRSSLEELHENLIYESYEEYLHTIRFYMLYTGMTYAEAIEFAKKYDTLGIWEEILESKYLEKTVL